MNTGNTQHYEVLGLVNVQAEETVLAAMRDETKVATQLAEMLEPEDFANAKFGLAFWAMRNLLMGIDPIDAMTVSHETMRLNDEYGLKLFVSAAEIDSYGQNGKDPIAYAHALKKLAWLRKAGDFAYWMAHELQGHPKPEELFTAAQERWQQLQPAVTNKRFVYGWDALEMHAKVLDQRIANANEGESTPFDWPWASWNRIVRPLRPGMVGMLAAPDGMGKTTYLEMIAEHWASKGLHVVYVHLEDALDYKLDRQVARVASLAMDTIEDGKLTKAELSKVNDAKATIESRYSTLHYYHAAGESMTAITRELASRVAEGVCQAIVFDYIDKVQPTRGQAKVYGDNSWERQANDMEQLKTFAERNSLPIFTATQGNKDMQGTGTQTRKNIQGSGQKSQKSQLVVILTRDIVGDAGLYDERGTKIADAGEYSPVVNVRIDKQNRGRTGGFKQVLIGKYFQVRDFQQEG